MFRHTPEQRLWLVKQRQAQLIHEAEQYRVATAIRGDPADRLPTGLFKSIRTGLGGQLAAVRRGLSGHEAPCNDPCPDCARS